jgi:hypothetical protein
MKLELDNEIKIKRPYFHPEGEKSKRIHPDFKSFIEDFSIWLEEADEGETWTVGMVEMTDQEVAELNELGGW